MAQRAIYPRATRAARGTYSNGLRPLLAAIEVGSTGTVPLPGDKDERARLYRAVNTLAGLMFGIGNYQLHGRRDPFRVEVTRCDWLGPPPEVVREMRAAQAALIDWMAP